MKIGIIDADLLDNGTRHPNLACEKISGFHKEQGHDVFLITDYNDIDNYDKVLILLKYRLILLIRRGIQIFRLEERDSFGRVLQTYHQR